MRQTTAGPWLAKSPPRAARRLGRRGRAVRSGRCAAGPGRTGSPRCWPGPLAELRADRRHRVHRRRGVGEQRVELVLVGQELAGEARRLSAWPRRAVARSPGRAREVLVEAGGVGEDRRHRRRSRQRVAEQVDNPADDEGFRDRQEREQVDHRAEQGPAGAGLLPWVETASSHWSRCSNRVESAAGTDTVRERVEMPPTVMTWASSEVEMTPNSWALRPITCSTPGTTALRAMPRR